MKMDRFRFGSLPVDSRTRVIVLISTLIYNLRRDYIVSLGIGTDGFFSAKVPVYLLPSCPISPPLRPSTLTTYQPLALPGSHTPAQARCRSPEFSLGLRPRLFKSVLLVPNPGMLLHHTTQGVRVISCVQLGVFNMSLCVVEPALIAKQHRQVVMRPK